VSNSYSKAAQELPVQTACLLQICARSPGGLGKAPAAPFGLRTAVCYVAPMGFRKAIRTLLQQFIKKSVKILNIFARNNINIINII
jgi:hypothetical protein